MIKIFDKLKKYRVVKWISENNKILCTQDKVKKKFKHKDPKIYTLAPKDDIQKGDLYIQKLNDAINHSKVFNIAIAGSYGSGKSSIIESYKKHYKNNKYITISLATFLETTPNSESSKEKINLERYILKQLFYKVKHTKLPNTRFKKINNLTKIKVLKNIFLIAIASLPIALFYLDSITHKWNSIISKMVDIIPIIKGNIFLANMIIVVLISISIYILLILIVEVYSKMKIKAIKFSKGEVEFNKEKENSFDECLDEIVYLFKYTDYNVVFFEDLDRFNDIEIFEKLRNLNKILNESEEIFSGKTLKRKINFVYAIKDDLFGEKLLENGGYVDTLESSKNRTKFFEYIVSVIPVVNTYNSYGEINFLLEKYGIQSGEISEELRKDISIFIDDKRLITNIVNEFGIYYEKLKEDIINYDKGNKLFAIISYKNLYPVDFEKLKKREGNLYNIVLKKEKYIEEAKMKKELEIEEMRKILVVQKEKYINTTWEVACVFKEKLSSLLNDGYIKYKNREYSVENIGNIIEFFNLDIQEEENLLINKNRNSYGCSEKPIVFERFIDESIGKELFDKYKSLKIFEEEFNSDIKKIEGKIYFLEQEKIFINNKSIKDLIKKVNIFEDGTSKFLKMLLRKGYVDEDYEQLISYFREGSITGAEKIFLQKISAGEEIDYNYKIKNTKEIINMINIDDFKELNVLNFDLVKALLDTKNLKKKVFLESIANIEEKAKLFLDKLLMEKRELFELVILEVTNEKKIFFSNLIKKKYFGFEREVVLIYLKKINIKDMEEIDLDFCLSDALSNKEILKDEEILKISEKFIEAIKILNVKFKELDITNLDIQKIEKIFKVIEKESLYELTNNMINNLMKILFNRYKEEFNYNEIIESNLENLKNLINDNLEGYLRDIFISSHYEDLGENKYMVKIFNDIKVNKDIKIKIIEEKNFFLEDLSEINEDIIKENLIQHHKMKVCWENILVYYKEKGLNIELIKYIEKNVEKLKMLNVESEEYDDLERDILFEEEISTDTMKMISSSFRVGGFAKVNESQCRRITNERLNILIELKKIDFDLENYEVMDKINKKTYFIESNIEGFLEEFESYSINNTELSELINSKKIQNKDKAVLINKVKIEDLIVEKDYIILEKIIKEFCKSDSNKEKLVSLEREIKKAKLENLFSREKEYTIRDILYELRVIDEKYSEFSGGGGSFRLVSDDLILKHLEIIKSKGIISSYSVDELKVNRRKSIKFDDNYILGVEKIEEVSSHICIERYRELKINNEIGKIDEIRLIKDDEDKFKLSLKNIFGGIIEIVGGVAAGYNGEACRATREIMKLAECQVKTEFILNHEEFVFKRVSYYETEWVNV